MITNDTLAHVNVADLDWPEAVEIAAHRISEGAPVARTFVLDSGPRHEVGYWRITPGRFTTVHEGYLEFIQILSGRGALIHANGERTELRPGVACAMGDGWNGEWLVEEELTKAYTIVPTGA